MWVCKRENNEFIIKELSIHKNLQSIRRVLQFSYYVSNITTWKNQESMKSWRKKVWRNMLNAVYKSGKKSQPDHVRADDVIEALPQEKL